MDNSIDRQIKNLSKVWPTVKGIFSVPHSDKEYRALVKILDSLIDEIGNQQTHPLAPVMETIGNLIANYEDQKHPVKEASPLQVLKYLMQEHGLRQSDLTEIGSQGVVSEILTGKRTLNLEQIKNISHRFQVSPLVFIDTSAS